MHIWESEQHKDGIKNHEIAGHTCSPSYSKVKAGRL
jgi:hypothetical protein